MSEQDGIPGDEIMMTDADIAASDRAFDKMHAREQRRRRRLTVWRCGPIYLVGDRETCVIVDVDRGTTSPVVSTQSCVAHIHTNEPWDVVADHAGLPELVRSAVDRFLETTKQNGGV